MPGRLLFLAHRLPYPPDKGEKIRAWHILDHLAERWDVDLGCLVDDPADLTHLPVLQSRCAHVEWRATGSRLRAASRALLGLRPGQPLSLGWFRDRSLLEWAWRGLGAGRYDGVFVYSSAMAPYAMAPHAMAPGVTRHHPPRVLDMVDVDSAKWAAYAAGARSPMRHVWSREARTLLAFERAAAASFDQTLFVSREEAGHFAALAPEALPRLGWIENGVDCTRFDPATPAPRPYAAGSTAIVFTGTMNYRPNIEAVTWFAQQVLPQLRKRPACPEFHIVGAKPTAAVQALARLPGVFVTGPVADVRAYLAHAAVAVAPLQIARGIQNKVLEAMAMARPVVATAAAFEGVRAMPGRDLLVADTAAAFASAIDAILDGRYPGLGRAARAAVRAGHNWAATLQPLDRMFAPSARGPKELPATRAFAASPAAMHGPA